MTRSEQIQKQIDKIKATCEKCKIKTVLGDECCALKLTLELFLAEQKRAAGCETCKVQSCRNCVKVKICQRSYQAEHGKCAFNQNGFQANEFCCDCGRDLTEGESV